MSFCITTKNIDVSKSHPKKKLKHINTGGISVEPKRAKDKDGNLIPPQPSRIAVSTHNLEAIQEANKKKKDKNKKKDKTPETAAQKRKRLSENKKRRERNGTIYSKYWTGGRYESCDFKRQKI